MTGRFPSTPTSCKQGFARNDSGATMVEFGFVALPALLLILAILEVGYSNFMQERMEAAVRQTGRLVLTGAAQNLKSGGAPLTAQQFRDQVLCPKLPATMKCADVFVNIDTAATAADLKKYVNANASGLNPPNFNNANNSYNLGSRQNYVIVQAAYPLPLYTPAFLTGNTLLFKGRPTRLVMAFAAFRNEPF